MEFAGKKYVWTSEDDKPFTQGGNSYLYSVRNDNFPSPNALKLYKAIESTQKRKGRFFREIEIVEKLKDIPGCIQLIDSGEYQEKPFFVMPFYANGTFKKKYLDSNDGSKSDIKLILGDFLKVLQIVKDVHSLGLAVRDIKPQNILIDDENNPILTDFGLSLWADTNPKDRLSIPGEVIGSAGYSPPEWSESEPDISHFPGDIWGLGRCLWAMCAGKNAPKDFDTLGGENTHLNQFLNKEYANYVQEIVTACTSQNPIDRPDIEELISSTQGVLGQIENGNERKIQTRDDLKSYIKSMSASILNSRPVLDANRADSEINIKLGELNQAAALLHQELELVAAELNREYENEIGGFRAYTNLADWTIRVPEINTSQNGSWKKSVTLRFDPNQKTEQHNNMSYVIFQFYLGLTNERQYFWSVYSRDQGSQQADRERVYETLKPKSIITLAQSKISQIPAYTKVFVEIIMKHFES